MFAGPIIIVGSRKTVRGNVFNLIVIERRKDCAVHIVLHSTGLTANTLSIHIKPTFCILLTQSIFTLTTLYLATRMDCSLCRPSSPLCPHTLVHLMRGGSWVGVGRRVKTQGSRTLLASCSLTIWCVTFLMFTTGSDHTRPEERGGEREDIEGERKRKWRREEEERKRRWRGRRRGEGEDD